MTEKNKIDEIRSDEVQEILGHIPSWIIRWGMSVLYILTLIIILISWIIKYPDYIDGSISVQTKNPPVKLLSKDSGLLKDLIYKSGDTIQEGQIIASIENQTSFEVIEWIDNQTIIIDSLLKSENYSDLNLFLQPNTTELGSFQKEYNELIISCHDLTRISLHPYNTNQIENLKKQIDFYSRLVTISHRKLVISEKEFQNDSNTYQIQKSLFDKGVISKSEYKLKENSFYISSHKVEEHKQNYIQNNITLTKYKKQLNDLKYSIFKEKSKFLENINNYLTSIRNKLSNWKLNYSLTSPIDGVLMFTKPLNENQNVSKGEPLFVVSPIDKEFVGIMSVSSLGFGKIQKGQTVYVKLDNYPFQQYGQLIGKVNKVHVLPNKEVKNNSLLNYIEVSFKNTETTYGQTIHLYPENTGSAQIVTENRRIINRIFSFIKKNTKR